MPSRRLRDRIGDILKAIDEIERFTDAQPWVIRIGHRSVYCLPFWLPEPEENLMIFGIVSDNCERLRMELLQ